MNKISIYTLFLLGVLVSGCDKLPDELFDKSAVITKNGFQNCDIDYVESGQVTTNISVSVSGTSSLANDATVGLVVDADTLQAYNFEKYRNNTASYYELLPADCYEIANPNVVVKKGTEYSTMPIKFNLDKIDKFKNFVLPLSINSATGCSIGKAPYNTVMLNILLSNSFSGQYTMVGSLKDSLEVTPLELNMSRVLRVVDNNTCYIYAGNIEETNVNKAWYIIKVKVNEDKTLTLTSLNPKLELRPTKSDLAKDINVQEVTVTPDAINHNKQNVLTKLYLSYKYKDFTNPDFPTTRTFSGYLLDNKVVYINK